MILILSWSCALAFVLSAGLVILLARFAPKWGLVDVPAGRKNHEGQIPLVGGIAIYGSSIVVAQVFGMMSNMSGLFWTMGLLGIVGVLDDLFNMPAKAKLLGQAVAVLLLMIFGQVLLTDLGFLMDGWKLQLNALSLPFTFLCFIGVINAFNFVDGADGLAGGVTLIGLTWFAALAGTAGLLSEMALLILFASSVLGFLIFNLRHRWQTRVRVFMGDAGSMMLGFLLASFAIQLSQGHQAAFPPIVAVWILGLPLLDTVSIMLRRILRGKSPFVGDRGHIHHILIDMGLTVSRAVFMVLILTATIGAVGVVAWQMGASEHALFVGFLILFVVYGVGISYAHGVLRRSRMSPATPLAEARIFID